MKPGIDIGEMIRSEFEKTGWTVAYFAQQIQKDRTIVYHIFKRKIIDTALLYDISMALNTDFFQYYSRQLEQNNKRIRQQKEEIVTPIPVQKKKVFLELELTKDEYTRLLNEHFKPESRDKTITG